MKKYCLLIIFTLTVLLKTTLFANWNQATSTITRFLKAMNSLNMKQAQSLCAYQMQDYFHKNIKPFLKKAKTNPKKYKAHYYVFKKEKAGNVFSFYAFIHIYNQKAVRYAVFTVERVNRVFKVTRMHRISPVKVITR